LELIHTFIFFYLLIPNKLSFKLKYPNFLNIFSNPINDFSNIYKPV
jgi:hypothetical protein